MLKQLLTGNLVLQDLAEKILAERRLVEMGKAGEVGEVGEVGKAGEMREGGRDERRGGNGWTLDEKERGASEGSP
jgi:hypothetical protein